MGSYRCWPNPKWDKWQWHHYGPINTIRLGYIWSNRNNRIYELQRIQSNTWSRVTGFAHNHATLLGIESLPKVEPRTIDESLLSEFCRNAYSRCERAVCGKHSFEDGTTSYWIISRHGCSMFSWTWATIQTTSRPVQKISCIYRQAD